MNPATSRAPAGEAVTDASLSAQARGLIGSEVLRIAAEVRALVAAGQPVCNLTVGDFDPREFSPPASLLEGVRGALASGHTNYPPSNGVLPLRESIVRFVRRELGLEVPIESVLVAGGARPLIYATYRTLVDPGEAVAFPVPSWNNNHYCHLSSARAVPIEVNRASDFHPTREQVRELLPRVRLLALNSPLNPTGTAIDPDTLEGICRDLVDENARRRERGERPVFLMYDMVYWALEFARAVPVLPATRVPEVAPYTVLLDAISKSLAATGLRVGWSIAAPAVTQRMSDLLGHVGAWAPKAEQMATAEFLDDAAGFASFRAGMQQRLRDRLERLHRAFEGMRARGLPVESVAPEGTLYLSARFDLIGRRAGDRELRTNEDVRRLLLQDAGIAVVPFQAFGLDREDGWFRLSVGGASVEAIDAGMERLANVLEKAIA